MLSAEGLPAEGHVPVGATRRIADRQQARRQVSSPTAVSCRWPGWKSRKLSNVVVDPIRVPLR